MSGSTLVAYERCIRFIVDGEVAAIDGETVAPADEGVAA